MKRTKRPNEIRVTDREDYRAGHMARAAGEPKHPPAHLDPAGKSFWLAGFHDREIETGHSILENRS